MKKSIKWTALLLALLLCINTFSIPAFAQDEDVNASGSEEFFLQEESGQDSAAALPKEAGDASQEEPEIYFEESEEETAPAEEAAALEDDKSSAEVSEPLAEDLFSDEPFDLAEETEEIIASEANVSAGNPISSVILKYKTKQYTGKAITQTNTTVVKAVILGSAKTLKLNNDYTISYKNNIKVGTAAMIVTGKGRYSGTIKKTFRIVPSGTEISGIIPSSKAFTVRWKKQTTQTTGYQIQCATDKNFTQNRKTITVASRTTVGKKVGKLMPGTKYFVRVRTYKTVNGKKYCSAWSPVKTTTTPLPYNVKVANGIVKVGNYYFKNSDGKVYFAKSKNGTYKAAGFKGNIYSQFFTNGDKIYVIEETGEDYCKLSRYVISSGSLRTLKKLSKKASSTYADYGWVTWHLSSSYKNVLFLTRTAFGEFNVKTYGYNTLTEQYALKKANCDIFFQTGQYVIGRNEFPSDRTSHKYSLYKTDGNGKLTLLKKLGDAILYVRFADGYAYYAKYPGRSDESETRICRCKKTGTGAELLGIIYNCYSIDKITSTYTEYYDASSMRHYRYYYATGEYIEI